MSKVHCILCDRKDPFMWHIRLPRNKITVPVCPKCAERYALYNKDITSLEDLIKPVIQEAIKDCINKEGEEK